MIERARAPLSALRPVVPSAFSPGPLLRDDLQESLIGSTNSPNIPDISGSSFGDVSTPTLSKPVPVDISDPRVSEALPVAHESPRFKPSSSSDREALVSRDEPKMLADRLPSTLPSELAQSRTSEASSPSDPPSVSSGASSSVSATEQPDEMNATRRAQALSESTAPSARAKQPDQPPPSAHNSPESLIEVNVSIGSIDFRSARPAAPVKRSEAHPHVTLDSYLQRGKRDAR
jgi:hypothetical protein